VDLPSSNTAELEHAPKGSARETISVPSHSRPPTTDKHILLVDDEISLLKIGENLLKRAGFAVTSFNDPHLAWKAFDVAPELYDVVVTDHSMGSMSGSELARKISERHSSTPVILCTGHGAGLAAEAEKQMGFRRILHKPYEFQELYDTVLEALNATCKPIEIPPQA
jgi:DNA-binding NtrC family response regulator